MTLKEWLESPDLNINTEEFVRICHEQDEQIQKDIDFLLDEQQSKHEKQLNELNALLNESRAREARLDEMVPDMRAALVLVRDWMRAECPSINFRVAVAERIEAVLCISVPECVPIRWLEAREKRAAADEMENLAKERDEATAGEEISFFSGVMTTDDCKVRAAALRAEADALEDQFINTTKQGE